MGRVQRKDAKKLTQGRKDAENLTQGRKDAKKLTQGRKDAKNLTQGRKDAKKLTQGRKDAKVDSLGVPGAVGAPGVRFFASWRPCVNLFPYFQEAR